jgi:protein-disulfide isomerase
MQIINNIKSILSRRLSSIFIANLIIIFAFIGSNYGLINTASAQEDKPKCANELSNKRIFNNDMVIGNRDAKVIFIEYFAPTCAHCVDYHLKIFPELKRKYIDTGRIAYVMRECVGNKQDFDASLLSRCQDNTASYLELMHQILTTQDSWAYSKDYRASLYKIANDHGISDKQYDTCLDDDIKAKILFNHAKLLVADVDFIGTPSFYINGKLYKGEYSLGGLSEAIKSELTKKVGR